MRHAASIPLVLALALAAVPSGADAWRGERGDGTMITERREVGGPFDAVALRGALDARVRVGPAASVAVTIDRNLQPLVRTRLDGSTLVVEPERDLRPSSGARVEVTLPVLRALSTSGSADAVIEGGAGDLSLSTSGSGGIRWSGEADALTVSTHGSGDVRLEGRAATLAVSTSGSGDVNARGLTVRDVDARTSGSGDVTVTMDGGTLRARTSGSGDVTYHGNARVEARTSGSGEVIAR